MEILATSLASCTAATLRMYIDRKAWDVGTIDVEVEFENYPLTKRSTFKRDISFQGVLSDEQIKRLYLIAESCPVHKILTGDIEIFTKMVNNVENT